MGYAREDQEIAIKLYNDLKYAGIDPWLDRKDLLPGQNWKIQIRKAIQSSEYFLALISSHSVSKTGYVQYELKEGLKIHETFPESEIYLIPVRLDDCEPFDERLHYLQWVDLFPSYEEGLQKILHVFKLNRGSEQEIVENYPHGFALKHRLWGFDSVIYRIAWSPDGQSLALPSRDGTIQIWDAERGELRQILKGHSDWVTSVTWLLNGRAIASGSRDKTIRFWNLETGEMYSTLEGHLGMVFDVALSPDGQTLASCSEDRTIRLWDIETKESYQIIKENSYKVNNIVWSPDGMTLASLSFENVIRLWNVETGALKHTLKGHSREISNVAWSPDGRILVSASNDNTIRVWEPKTGTQRNVLEGHTDNVNSVSFSCDGRLLASKSSDNTVRIWRCDIWESIETLSELASKSAFTNLSFHPKAPIFATIGEQDTIFRIWEIDISILLRITPITTSSHYTNARVVLMGETSTGKTCLARALMREPFEPQESTHGMKVWNFDTEVVEQNEGESITRNIMLWDLAGQIDYQIVHQLFLDETALAIVLFDPTHPENPFAGVGYWERALQRIVGKDCPKLLVAGRVDRGHPTVTTSDIEEFCRIQNYSEFIASSAKTGQGIDELRNAIKKTIPWDKLPVTSSPELQRDIREYLLMRRVGDDILTRQFDLREAFTQRHPGTQFTEAEFATVISHMQIQGLLWRLSFGDHILLKPELLNDYASAVVRFARKHPEGIGCVAEQDIIGGQIDFEDLERLTNKEIERSLLHAVIELLLKRELALREGEQLVFPSKFNRKLPKYPNPPIREVAYSFEGAIENIYATLVVRLFYCGAFNLKNFWKNAAEFFDLMGNTCGFILKTPSEGRGILSIFFENATDIANKIVFLQFIHEHLQKRAIPRSVKRERIYRCPAPECNEEVENKKAIEIRLKKGQKTITCQYCDKKIPLIDLLEEKFGDPELLQQVQKLEKEAEEKKEREVAWTTTKAKSEINEFDVFLAHNGEDKPQVEIIAETLKQRGLNPWIDTEQVPPGRWFQDLIQQAIHRVKSAAVIIGTKGLGRWQIVELRSFISRCVEDNIPVIPVLLPGVDELPSELPFFEQFVWVNFKKIDDMGAMDDLEWGITGVHPQRDK